MTVAVEKRLLQFAIALGGCVPVGAGLAGALLGPGMVLGQGVVGAPLDSHYRYLSGLLLAIGLAFWSCIPAVERRTARVRLLTLIVVTGGLARAVGLVGHGYPGPAMTAAFGMELVVTPLLCLWQGRLARRFARPD